MTWAVSANAGLVAAAATALLVVTPPAEPPGRLRRLGRTRPVGGLTQAALIAVWPKRRWRVQRSALSRAYRSLAADARALADNPTGEVDTQPMISLREAFTSTEGQA